MEDYENINYKIIDRKRCNVHVIEEYNYYENINLALEIAENPEIMHGDIICGTDYHMNSTSAIYKQENTLKIVNLLSGFPETIFNIPVEISKFIENPHLFYEELLDEEESLSYHDTFISYVELGAEHYKFISKFTEPDFEKYTYSIDSNNLYIRKTNSFYGVKSIKYKNI